jgi:hypothetical protein
VPELVNVPLSRKVVLPVPTVKVPALPDPLVAVIATQLASAT